MAAALAAAQASRVAATAGQPSESRPGEGSTISLRPLERRCPVVPGQRLLVIPVAASGATPPKGEIAIGGVRGGAALVWMGLRAPAAAMRPENAWLGIRGQWRSAAARPSADEIGFYAVIVPCESIDGNGPLVLPGGAAVYAETVGGVGATPSPALVGAARALAPSGAPAGLLRAMVEPALAWPTERWRAELVLDALEPASNAGVVRTGHADADGPVDALAEQSRLRWHAAVNLLAEHSAPLARRLAGRLLATASFADGTVAPVWPGDASGATDLLNILLDPASDGRARETAAAQFLGAQREFQAWVIDDWNTAQGGHAIGVLSLDASVSRVSVVEGQSRSGSQHESAFMSGVRVILARNEALGAVREVDVVGNDGRVRLSLAAAALRASPPGLDLGPLWAQWDLPSWLAGVARSPVEVAAGPGPGPAGAPLAEGPARPVQWVTAARLMKLGGAWTVYVECAQGSGGLGAGEELTVWLGPAGRGSSVRISPAGKNRAGVRTHTWSAQRGDAETQPGWGAWVPLTPEEAKGGQLLIAIERRDSRGVRSTWPRPVMPWQAEPGRAAVDLGGWDLSER